MDSSLDRVVYEDRFHYPRLVLKDGWNCFIGLEALFAKHGGPSPKPLNPDWSSRQLTAPSQP